MPQHPDTHRHPRQPRSTCKAPRNLKQVLHPRLITSTINSVLQANSHAPSCQLQTAALTWPSPLASDAWKQDLALSAQRNRPTPSSQDTEKLPSQWLGILLQLLLALQGILDQAGTTSSRNGSTQPVKTRRPADAHRG